MADAVYAIAYVEHRRKASGQIVHGWVWAAWWKEKPTADVWASPDAFGVVEQVEETLTWSGGDVLAEVSADAMARNAILKKRAILADLAPVIGLRAEPPRPVYTSRINDAFARAAFRESRGKPANFRAPKPSKYATPRGFSRPPEMPAAEFFRPGHTWPPRDDGTPEELRFFGLRRGATRDDVMAAYRERAKREHPDQGGSGDMGELVRRRDEALRAVVA